MAWTDVTWEPSTAPEAQRVVSSQKLREMVDNDEYVRDEVAVRQIGEDPSGFNSDEVQIFIDGTSLGTLSHGGVTGEKRLEDIDISGYSVGFRELRFRYGASDSRYVKFYRTPDMNRLTAFAYITSSAVSRLTVFASRETLWS